MNQVSLELDSPAAQAQDRTGFDIGWDHAHHALVPPAELLHPGTPVCQGWMAARAVFGRRTLAANRHTRLWLALRLSAWRQGLAFDTLSVTPNYLGQIERSHCPVRRVALGGAAGDADAAVVLRLNPQAGYVAGNLVMVSQAAAQAAQAVEVGMAVRRARACEQRDGEAGALDAAGWWRLAALLAFATPLPYAEAARLPLAVLPPNRVRLLNAAQGLQAMVTELFASDGWSQRCRDLGLLLPEHTLRHDFNLFVGAMAPRVLEAATTAAERRRALEDAWLHERVQRRWQHLVLSLGEQACEALLEQAAARVQPTRRVLQHTPSAALESWGLPAPQPGPLRRRVSGRLPVPPAAPLAAVAGPAAPACRA